MPCERCGAVVDPGALACTYCGALTPAAAVARQREADDARDRAQWIAAEEHRRATAARARVEALATQAVLWGALGVFCCLPFGVVGFVQGVRARGLALETKQPPPPRALIGLVLGVLSLVSTTGFFAWAIVSTQAKEQRASARIEELTRQVGAQASSPALDRATACALAEAYALRNGWNGSTGYDLHDFECVGKMVSRGDRMELDDFRFRTGTETANDTFVCFERGAAWLVEELRRDACHGGVAPAGASSAAKGDPIAPPQHATPRASASPAPSASGSLKGRTK